LIALSDKRFFKSVVEKYNWFRHYGIDTPEIEYEEYTLPDDKGSILKLDVEITPETKIKKFIGDVITIEKTDNDWAGASYYTEKSGNYYSRKHYKCYDVPNDDDDDYKNIPACYQKLNGATTVDSGKTLIKDNVNNAVKTGKVVSIKKVSSPSEKENTDENTLKNEQIRVIVWNPAKKEFDASTRNTSEMYRHFDLDSSRKYTIYSSAGSLANRLGVEDYSLTTLTACQIANRVSKMVYDEHVEKLAEKVKTLEKNEEVLESKGTKARQHIIKLKAILNAVTRMLNKSYEPGQSFLTYQETECMGDLWKFLYSTRKAELEKTKLGIFIQSLTNKEKEETMLDSV
jgi:hypothetical protein